MKKKKELCTECGMSGLNLRLHLNSVHYVEEQTCSQCGKVLKSLIALKTHFKEIHEKHVLILNFFNSPLSIYYLFDYQCALTFR